MHTLTQTGLFIKYPQSHFPDYPKDCNQSHLSACRPWTYCESGSLKWTCLVWVLTWGNVFNLNDRGCEREHTFLMLVFTHFWVLTFPVFALWENWLKRPNTHRVMRIRFFKCNACSHTIFLCSLSEPEYKLAGLSSDRFSMPNGTATVLCVFVPLRLSMPPHPPPTSHPCLSVCLIICYFVSFHHSCFQMRNDKITKEARKHKV